MLDPTRGSHSGRVRTIEGSGVGRRPVTRTRCTAAGWSRSACPRPPSTTDLATPGRTFTRRYRHPPRHLFAHCLTIPPPRSPVLARAHSSFDIPDNSGSSILTFPLESHKTSYYVPPNFSHLLPHSPLRGAGLPPLQGDIAFLICRTLSGWIPARPPEGGGRGP